MQLKGRMKILTVDNYGIHIKFNKMMGKGEKTIPFNQIVSIEVKKPGFLNGYIYFQTIGSTGTRRQNNPHDMAMDDNSVQFNSKANYDIALYIKSYFEQWQVSWLNQKETSMSNADEIMKYKQLLDGGAITQEEFDAKKKQLLGL